jgi:hypothetical protein
MDDLDSEWRRKGATLSDKTAQEEFGPTREKIVRAVCTQPERAQLRAAANTSEWITSWVASARAEPYLHCGHRRFDQPDPVPHLLLDELDDQNGLLGGKAQCGQESDLEAIIVRHWAQGYRSSRAGGGRERSGDDQKP